MGGSEENSWGFVPSFYHKVVQLRSSDLAASAFTYSAISLAMHGEISVSVTYTVYNISNKYKNKHISIQSRNKDEMV